MKHYLLNTLYSGRTHLALATLTLILQRTPLPRLITFFQGLPSIVPSIRIVQSIALPAAAFAAPHALSGASSSKYTVDPSNPATFTVGETIVIGFSINIAPKSWTVAGDIPPGLRFTDLRQRVDLVGDVLATNYGVLLGEPTQAGTYQLTLTPWENEDGTGDTAPNPLTLNLTILPSTNPNPDPDHDPQPTPPPILHHSSQAQNLTLTWQNDSQAPYSLATSTDLKTWTPVTQTPTQANGTSRIEIPITSPTPAFYRLVPPQQ